LPGEKRISTFFPYSFILFKPKDIVSGDFYWIAEKNNKIMCTVADCTGHGVPGAFMSLLGHNLLENAVKNKFNQQPASILDSLNEELITVMSQEQGKSSVKNGMDIALITVDKTNMQLEYAGAHLPLYLIRNGELSEIKADKMSIGSFRENEKIHFSNHLQELKKNDLIYMFSDGFADQIGGPNRKKFYYSTLKDLLLSIHQLEMKEQKERLDEVFTNWKGKLSQTDDVLAMGIKITS
jgi:serine phosphatase RsbU (regulator of sigma subunit)